METNIDFQCLLNIQNFRNTIIESQHINCKTVFKFCIFEKMIQCNFSIDTFFQIDLEICSNFMRGIIVDTCNTFNCLIIDQIHNFLSQFFFIDHIWKFGKDDRSTAVFLCNLIFTTNTNRARTRFKIFANS